MYSIPPQSIYRRNNQRAFTLLEIMLVILLLGIASSYILPSLIPEDSVSKMQNEAEKFILLTKLAQEQVLISGQAVGLKKATDGYQFLTYQKEKWNPSTVKRLSKAHLNQAFKLNIFPGETIWQESLALEEAQNFHFDSEETKDNSDSLNQPDIYFWPSGEISPATVTLSAVDNPKRSLSISLEEHGDISLAEEITL